MTGKQTRHTQTRHSVRHCVLSCIVMLFALPRPVAAADRPPEFEAAIQKGAAYLAGAPGISGGSETGLVAYTLIAAGHQATSPTVKGLLDTLVTRAPAEGYKPGSHHIYEAGVEAMAFAAADREKYKPQIQVIANYLIKEQRAHGGWDYPAQDNGGDTSISQYALLGLWAAARAGIEVPIKTWDMAATWHLRTQLNDGGFTYHPMTSNKNPFHSMNVAGIGSLCITRIFLTGQQNLDLDAGEAEPAEKKKNEKAFGILEKSVTADEGKPLTDQPVVEKVYKPTVTKKSLDGAIGRGTGWLGKNFNVDNPTGWKFYFLYGMERAAALAGVDKFGGKDWYREGGRVILKEQAANGGWSDIGGPIPTTCFSILFLCRATEKIVPVTPKATPRNVPTFGTGVLAGGRGLPTDLSNVDTTGGQIKAKKVDTPLDQLLADLESAKATQSVEAVQATLVEAVQIGDREQLIKQKDLLLKLVRDNRVEVRRTAYWALGRCNDLRVAPTLIKGLSDADEDVTVEARNSLCILSRRPRGFGFPEDAIAKLPDQTTDLEKDVVAERWRKEEIERWREWYQRVRPYQERDRLPE